MLRQILLYWNDIVVQIEYCRIILLTEYFNETNFAGWDFIRTRLPNICLHFKGNISLYVTFSIVKVNKVNVVGEK